jgi:hypothetical protein
MTPLQTHHTYVDPVATRLVLISPRRVNQLSFPTEHAKYIYVNDIAVLSKLGAP